MKSFVRRKSVLIAIVALLITGLVVGGVLASIRMVTDSHLEMLKVHGICSVSIF
jgi:hypothetical protein